MFGAVNALFAGLAFAGVIVTVWMQKEELLLQRVEIEGQRTELKLQRQTMQKQQFEATFFRLLDFHESIVNGMTVIYPGNPTQNLVGRNYIEQLYEVFLNRYHETKSLMLDNFSEDKIISMVWRDIYGKYRGDLEVYHKTLDRVLDYLRISDPQNKEFYIDIIRSKFSGLEHALLIYHCMSENCTKSLSNLVSYFQLERDLPYDCLIELEHMRLFREITRKRDESTFEATPSNTE